MRPISNLNSVSIKNYGPQAETLAVIRELTKLGLIKTKSKSNKERKPKMIEDLKQESDMVGYTKTLEGSRGGQFPLRIFQGGMTQQQIEDINRENAARFAVLRNELEQQQQQQQEALQPLTRLANLASERFRGAQEVGAGQRASPFIQSTTIEEIPDTQTYSMSRTANPNAPEYTSEFAEEVFPEEETENISIAPPNLQPREKLGGGRATESAEELPIGVAFEEIVPEISGKPKKERKRKVSTLQEVADVFSLGRIPTLASKKSDIQDFYIKLTEALGESEVVFNTREEYLNEINNLLKEASSFMAGERN
jgi:hypothetical protein